jgi:hypothetical protein
MTVRIGPIPPRRLRLPQALRQKSDVGSILLVILADKRKWLGDMDEAPGKRGTGHQPDIKWNLADSPEIQLGENRILLTSLGIPL